MFQTDSSHIFGHVSYIEVKGVRNMADREEVLKIFPKDLRRILGQVPMDFDRIQEIRLRTQKPLLILCGSGEYGIKTDGSLTAAIPALKEARPGKTRRTDSERDEGYTAREQEELWEQAGIVTVSQSQMKETVEYMCSFSLYAAEEELRQGFITIQGGHRIGVAGRTMTQGQDIRLMKSISFINIRVAHEIRGCGDQVMKYLYSDNNRFLNTLIISPPRCGKTTLLRDIIRQVSDGGLDAGDGRKRDGLSVGVVDERSELGACYQGVPQNDLGMRTDVLDCCPKSQGMMMLVRSMAPQVIAVDEIGSRADVEAIEYVRNCGCALAATIHGSSLEDIRQKPAMKELLRQQAFERLILLDHRESAGHVACIWDGKGRVLYGAEPGSGILRKET